MNELKEIFDTFKKSPLRFLKRNFNLIIIIPTVLGGLWQIIELSQMSFSFIRFFSVGQIIPDGLLILMFLIIFFLSASLLICYLNRRADKEANRINQGKTLPQKGNLIFAIIYFILFLGTIFLIFYVNNYLISKIESTLNLFLYVPVNILIVTFSLFFIDSSLTYCENIKVFHHFEKVRSLLNAIPYLLQVVMLTFLAVQFHEAFMLPIDLKNSENIICKAEKIYGEVDFLEILYLNDKYVFVKCYTSTKDRKGNRKQSEIRIFKFEDLLDDSACIGNKRIRQEAIRDSIKYSQMGLPRKTK